MKQQFAIRTAGGEGFQLISMRDFHTKNFQLHRAVAKPHAKYTWSSRKFGAR